MEVTRVVEWTSQKGHQMKCKITVTREMQEEIGYADGYNIPLGKKPFANLYLSLYADGEIKVSTMFRPTKLNPEAKEIKMGAYAYIGKYLIVKEAYDEINRAIDLATEQAETDPEYSAYMKKVNQKIESEKAKIQEKFDEAKRSGKPVEIRRYCADCDDPNEECDLDMVYELAMPDGTKKIKRYHTW